MSKLRSWKQHWPRDFKGAKFVFLKRMRMGDNPEAPYVLPGERVTEEQKARLGAHRMRRWWEAQVVGLEENSPVPAFDGPSLLEPKVEEPVEEMDAEIEEEPTEPEEGGLPLEVEDGQE